MALVILISVAFTFSAAVAVALTTVLMPVSVIPATVAVAVMRRAVGAIAVAFSVMPFFSDMEDAITGSINVALDDTLCAIVKELTPTMQCKPRAYRAVCRSLGSLMLRLIFAYPLKLLLRKF